MRASGVLLPIFSLPGKYGIGCFSQEAYKFIDFLEKAGQTYWQILPIGPTGFGDSPYQSFSTFAGNPYFISLEKLIKYGWLTPEECEASEWCSQQDAIDYKQLYENRFRLLRKAYERSNIAENRDFHKFREENRYWLRDYALFMAVKDIFQGKSFHEWPEDIRYRWQYSMEYYQKKYYFEIEFYEFVQYEFYCQWEALKTYANGKGIRMIGDIPIYVAYDSADVWSHPQLFQMDKTGKPEAVAGCPPDEFSDTGQLWGNPLYRWDYHRETGYDWWIRRIEKSHQLYDVIRIDHFRGFDEYYSIPADAVDAIHGHWEKGPGIDLFHAVWDRLGKIPIIAEDLGYITDSVKELVKNTGFPNMKVLEFAFQTKDSSGPAEYLPYNYDKNCIVYTGTHDNDTLMGWLKKILPEEKRAICEYVGKEFENNRQYAREIIRLAHASVAQICIIPLQDYLYLESEARINTPSTLGNNWKWRVLPSQMDEELMERIKKDTVLYGRNTGLSILREERKA